MPTVAPSLIPTTPPATVIDVDPTQFDDGFGGHLFKVGNGPVWCSIDADSTYAICEMNEVDAQYKTIPIPSTCDYSFGYQIRLWSGVPLSGSEAEFTCSGGPYADPTNALTLSDNQRVKIGPFTCFVASDTVRCENEDAKFIVLGAKAWALGS
jgi:hypothetical protein